MHLTRLSILPQKSTLDDVLALEIESILSRRLQTIAYLKGLAGTPDQARQLIAHGHIAIDGCRVTVPSYMVKKDEEGEIAYASDSVLNDSMHPARPKADYKSPIPVKREVPADKAADKAAEPKKEEVPKQDEKPVETEKKEPESKEDKAEEVKETTTEDKKPEEPKEEVKEAPAEEKTETQEPGKKEEEPQEPAKEEKDEESAPKTEAPKEEVKEEKPAEAAKEETKKDEEKGGD